MFFGVFIGEEADGVGDKGSGEITSAGVPTLLEAFLNMSLRSACFIDEVFSCRKQNFRSWDYSPQVTDYQDFSITGCQIKLISLYYNTDQESNIPWTKNRYIFWFFTSEAQRDHSECWKHTTDMSIYALNL